MEDRSVICHSAAIAADAVHENDNTFTWLTMEKISAELCSGCAGKSHFSFSKSCRKRDVRLMWRDEERSDNPGKSRSSYQEQNNRNKENGLFGRANRTHAQAGN